MSARGSGFAVSIPDGLLEEIVNRVVDRLAPMLEQSSAAPAGWLDVHTAAEYAGCSIHALRRAMAKREVHFELTGNRAYFRAVDIDAWRGGLTRLRG